MAIRVASEIWRLVIIHTSVVMECVANSSFPSQKRRFQIYMELSYIDPQARVLNYCYK